jgi:hypothetical protein
LADLGSDSSAGSAAGEFAFGDRDAGLNEVADANTHVNTQHLPPALGARPMNYSSYRAAVAALDFYANQKKIPPSKLVLGVAFFGSSEDDSHEESYKNILAAYSMPGKSIWWTVDRSTMEWHSIMSASQPWLRRQNWERSMARSCFGI